MGSLHICTDATDFGIFVCTPSPPPDDVSLVLFLNFDAHVIIHGMIGSKDKIVILAYFS
jgi:hypothetical protein